MIAKLIRTYGRLFMLVVGALALYYAFSMTSDVNETLAALPIDGLSQVKHRTAGQRDLGALPLLLGDSGKRPASHGALGDSPLDLDAAFTPPIVERSAADIEPAKTDYFTILPRELSVAAFADGGAVISGANCGSHYVAVGQPIIGCSYPGPNGGMITPILLSVSSKGLVIGEPGTKRTIKVVP
jgi:hypothetical protein